MTQLHLCVNCGDPAPDAWLCPVCEALREEAKRGGEKWQYHRDPVAAVYAALTEYREKKQGSRH